MKIDKIMEQSVELHKEHKVKEKEIYDLLNLAINKISQFNDLSSKLYNNSIVLKSIYEEEINQLEEKKTSFTKFNSNDPFFSDDSIYSSHECLKNIKLESFHGNFELLHKIYLNDKLNNSFPEKGSHKVDKI